MVVGAAVTDAAKTRTGWPEANRAFCALSLVTSCTGFSRYDIERLTRGSPCHEYDQLSDVPQHRRSWRTSMPARPRRPSGSSTTPASHAQDRRGPRRRGHDGLDGAGAGARHHDHVAPRRRASGSDTAASTSSTRRATSTSPSRSSARCACSTAPSPCFDGVAGVEPQSETVWRQADKYGVPRIVLRQQDGPHRRRLLSTCVDDP